jgi:large subunit ribosomal protein L3
MAEARKRKEYTTPHRTGVLAEKKGMSAWFDPDTGARMPCTVLQVDRCQVVGHKTVREHGYWGVQVGFGGKKWWNVPKPELGVLAKRGIAPKQEIREFTVKGKEGLLPVGTLLEPSWFKVGQFVDCRSKTKGKGFAGVSIT